MTKFKSNGKKESRYVYTYENSISDPEFSFIDKSKRHFSAHIKLMSETFLGALLGVLLGFFVDLIFPAPRATEKVGATLGWVILQLFIDALLIFYIMLLAVRFNFFNQDDVEGMIGYLVFTILFFLVQTQLTARLNKLWKDISGRNLPNLH